MAGSGGSRRHSPRPSSAEAVAAAVARAQARAAVPTPEPGPARRQPATVSMEAAVATVRGILPVAEVWTTLDQV